MVGTVSDVECHQTQVGEIPEELWKEEGNQVHTKQWHIHLVAPQPTRTYIQETLSRQDTPGPGR